MSTEALMAAAQAYVAAGGDSEFLHWNVAQFKGFVHELLSTDATLAPSAYAVANEVMDEPLPAAELKAAVEAVEAPPPPEPEPEPEKPKAKAKK